MALQVEFSSAPFQIDADGSAPSVSPGAVMAVAPLAIKSPVIKSKYGVVTTNKSGYVAANRYHGRINGLKVAPIVCDGYSTNSP